MKKLWSIIIAVVMLGAILSGCGISKDLSISEVNDKIKASTDLSQMKEGDAAKLKKHYNIDSNDIDSFKLYLAPSNITADEIAIIKVKDESDIDGIKDKINKRVDTVSQNFKDYLPAQYDLIQKHVVKTNGKFIIFVISKDSDKIQSAFDKALK